MLELLSRGDFNDLHRAQYIIYILCMQTASEQFGIFSDDIYGGNPLLRLLFYINTFIFVTITLRSYERGDFKQFIVYYIRQFNESRRKAKKIKKRRKRN